MMSLPSGKAFHPFSPLRTLSLLNNPILGVLEDWNQNKDLWSVVQASRYKKELSPALLALLEDSLQRMEMCSPSESEGERREGYFFAADIALIRAATHLTDFALGEKREKIYP